MKTASLKLGQSAEERGEEGEGEEEKRGKGGEEGEGEEEKRGKGGEGGERGGGIRGGGGRGKRGAEKERKGDETFLL